LAYQFERHERIEAWIDAHPRYADAISNWEEVFLEDPADPDLERIEILGFDGDPEYGMFFYLIPDVPIPLVILLQLPHINPEGDIVLYASVIRPRGRHDIIPLYDMV
jgi:hypothetical protein